SPTHAVGMTSTSMNAMSHGQSRSQFSASNTLQLLAHAIGTSIYVAWPKSKQGFCFQQYAVTET
ncbi:hypothetical protein Tco_0208206, partial [Tanacetum coccineum]